MQKYGIDMKLIAGAVVAMSLLAGAAQAGDWRLVFGDRKEVYAVDFASIRTERRGISAWVLSINAAPDRGGASYSLTRTLYDCERAENAYTTFVDYDESGNVIDSTSGRPEWVPLVPDTIGYANMEAACFKKSHSENSWSNPSEIVSAYRDVLAEEN